MENNAKKEKKNQQNISPSERMQDGHQYWEQKREEDNEGEPHQIVEQTHSSMPHYIHNGGDEYDHNQIQLQRIHQHQLQLQQLQHEQDLQTQIAYQQQGKRKRGRPKGSTKTTSSKKQKAELLEGEDKMKMGRAWYAVNEAKKEYRFFTGLQEGEVPCSKKEEKELKKKLSGYTRVYSNGRTKVTIFEETKTGQDQEQDQHQHHHPQQQQQQEEEDYNPIHAIHAVHHIGDQDVHLYHPHQVHQVHQVHQMHPMHQMHENDNYQQHPEHEHNVYQEHHESLIDEYNGNNNAN